MMRRILVLVVLIELLGLTWGLNSSSRHMFFDESSPQQERRYQQKQAQGLANQSLKLCSCQENFSSSCPENTILSRYGDRNAMGDNVNGYSVCCKLCIQVSDDEMVEEEGEFQLGSCEIQSLTTSQCPDGTFLRGTRTAFESEDAKAMLPIECCRAYIQRAADPEWKAVFFCSSGVDRCSDSNSPVVGWEAQSFVNQTVVGIEPFICAQMCIVSSSSSNNNENTTTINTTNEQRRPVGTIYDSVLALIALSAVALALLMIATFSVFRYKQGRSGMDLDAESRWPHQELPELSDHSPQGCCPSSPSAASPRGSKRASSWGKPSDCTTSLAKAPQGDCSGGSSSSSSSNAVLVASTSDSESARKAHRSIDQDLSKPLFSSTSAPDVAVTGGGGHPSACTSSLCPRDSPTPKCILCVDRDVGVVAIPCGHACLCQSCAPRLICCPLCRLPMIARQRLYL